MIHHPAELSPRSSRLPDGAPCSASRPPCILLAEDDAEMRRLLGSTLRKDGYLVIEVRNGGELLDYIAEAELHPPTQAPDLLVSDIRMPGWNGLDVLATVRLTDWAMPIILITAFGDEETHAEARRLGARAVLDKPFDLKELRALVAELLPPAAD
jgi:DNA-binding response OmpR family regulator